MGTTDRKIRKEIVQGFLDLGFNVIPVDENKKPYNGHTGKILEWGKYQKEKIVNNGLFEGATGIAIVCGAISGNIECLDIDIKNDKKGTLWQEFEKLIQEHLSHIDFVIQGTKSAGYHFYYKCDETATKALAKNAEGDVILETRGSGALATVAPTPGYRLIKNKFSNVPVISKEDRALLFRICESFNEYVDEKEYVRPEKKEKNWLSTHESPFKDFNERGDGLAYLEKHGWEILYKKGHKIFLRRPGSKSKVPHATYNHIPNCLYPFSTNSYPFEDRKAYDNAAIFCLLECNNDWKETYKHLLDMGFGEKPQHTQSKRNSHAKSTIKRPPPIPVTEEESPDFPIEVFPEVYQEIINNVSDERDFPVDIFAASIMCVVSAGIGLTHQTKLANGWRQYPALYMAMVGSSASGKTPALKWAFKPIKELEEVYDQEYNQLMQDHTRIKEMSKSERQLRQITPEQLKEPKRKENNYPGLHT